MLAVGRVFCYAFVMMFSSKRRKTERVFCFAPLFLRTRVFVFVAHQNSRPNHHRYNLALFHVYRFVS